MKSCRLLMALVLVGGGLALPARAEAQEPDEDEVGREPGPQHEPPAPDDDGGGDHPPTLETDPRERNMIRGSHENTPRESEAKKQQREWEEKTFSPPPGAPPDADLEGLRDDDAIGAGRAATAGKAALPPELSTHPAPVAGAKLPPRPEDVRPDLPWLEGLVVGDLPVRWDARVIRYLEFYRDDPKGRSIMSAWLRDQGRFRDMILASIRKHDLPEDLLYVCMIESSYDPWEYSRVGASGLWQFMPGGGRIYGLQQDFWIDERNDPEKATEAAMLYWRDLFDRFHDWHLALAAYNAGWGAVLKAIAKYNTNDFWALLDAENGLPFGSSIYVPKAIAAAIVGRNRKAFGYDTVQEAPPFEFDRVVVEKSVGLAVIAKAAGTTESEIKWLNPELKRNRTPPGAKTYSVRIPRGKKEQFARAFPQLRGEWDGYEAYLVRHGERFEDIATTYGVSDKKLRELNGVTDLTEMRGGTVIVVPKIDPQVREQNRKKAEDDLYRSDVAPGEPGDPMIVAVPDKDAQVPGKKRVFYRVVAGDTLDQVATALGVGPAELAGWNGLATGAAIQPRMVLVAWVPPGFDAAARQVALLDDSRLMLVTSGSEEHLDLVEGRKGRKRVRVIAKKGDTLESLGKPHNLDKYDMARINRRSYSKAVEPGEELVVYVVVDKAKARKAGVLDKKKKHKTEKGRGRAKAPKGR
jgi:membrane-bound lytic murein transglycosylase D